MKPAGGIAATHFVDRLWPFVVTASGTGAGGALLPDGGANGIAHPGVVELTSGTDADGKAAVGTTLTALVLSGAVWTWEALVQVPVLSDETNSFKVHVGGINGPAGGDAGVFFKTIHSYKDGRWTCQAVDGEIAPEPVDSGVPVVAGQWYRLKIIIDATAATAKFYIDGQYITTMTSGIPAGATLGMVVALNKTAGTTARKVVSDWQSLSVPMEPLLGGGQQVIGLGV